MNRGQATLVATAVALVLLTATLAASLALADRTFAAGTREPTTRHAAVAAADRLVAADSPYTAPANVLDPAALAATNASQVRTQIPPLAGRPFEIRLDGEVLVGAGDPTAAGAVERLVLRMSATAVRLSPRFDRASNYSTTLPRRTRQVQLTIRPPGGTTVERVRANDRVVLANASGLVGTFTIGLSVHETVTIKLDADGPLPRGRVQLSYRPATTTKARLTVVVGRA